MPARSLPVAGPPLPASLLDALPDPVVAISAEGRVLYANAAFLSLSGRSAGEVEGKGCSETVRGSHCAACPRAAVVASGEAAERTDARVETKGGTVEMCVRIAPFRAGAEGPPGVVELFRDVSRLSALRDEYRSASDLYRREVLRSRAILDAVPPGVLTVDREGRVVSMNRSLERMTGYREREAIGHPYGEILSGGFGRADCPLLRSLRTGEVLRGVEIPLRTRSGEHVPADCCTAPLKGGEGPEGAVCAVRDLRDMKGLPPPASRNVREFQGMVSRSPRMHEVFDLAAVVAESDATVLIEGESGTGKELTARAIHRLSNRAGGPFLGVNCASLNENLMESELFGHVRGAYTGALRDRAGRFETAEGGTLFLDEVSSIGPHLQAKLLRVIQEREYQRVGETTSRKTDVRIIAATNRRLKELIDRGEFRDDLYYRLNVFSLRLPPLRERVEDIPPLVEHFLAAEGSGRPLHAFAPSALRALLEYPWPGNVRELENAVERARICSRGEVIPLSALPPEIRDDAARRTASSPLPPEEERPAACGEGNERERLLSHLAACRWNRTEAANRLGVSRVTLWRRMKAAGIAVPKGGGGT